MNEPETTMNGKVAVVTGGGRAIGQEICTLLAGMGASIASLDLTDSAETVQRITNAGGRAVGLTCDVTDEEHVDQAISEVVDQFGSLDILVNNAGIFSTMPRRPFWEIPSDEWDLMLRVNVRSVFLVTKAASAPMRKAKRGSIVNIASNVFSFGMGEFMHYVASKGAVVGMTRAMARELGPFGIAVNSVSPGLVTTEVTTETVPEQYRAQVANNQCLRTPIVPSDIAAAVAYLAGDSSRMVTGQNLMVNGGATMGPA